MKNRVLPTLIVALAGAVAGSFMMMLYASSHFGGVTGPNNTPPAIAAAPLSGVSDQDRIVSAVKRTKASVVAIVEEVNGRQVIPVDPFFQQFFGGQAPNIVQPYKAKASGSGFVYDSNGDIITNAHVVNPPSGGRISKMTVVFANGDKVPAHLVSANIGADLALIKVDNYGKLPPPLALADSDKLEQGQWAIAIGEPLELQQSVTVGVVSAFNREEPIPNENGQVINFKGMLQTSAPINPGNSGGPLIDIDGRVIGVNQSTVRSSYAQGIGFAIPSNTVKRIASELSKTSGIHEGTDTGYMGILMGQLTPGIKNQIGYNGQNGVAVVQVISGSPADAAGLQPGDVILKADGKDFGDFNALHNYIGGKKPNDTVRLEVWSQGAKKLVSVKLGEKPAASLVPQQPPQDQQP